jgi:hypothetical protein
MKKSLLILAGLMLCAITFAQNKTFGIAGDYNFKHKKFEQYILVPSNASWDAGSLTANIPDLPHFHFTIDIGPIIGPGDSGGGTVGMQASHTWSITKDGKWKVIPFGLGRIERGQPVLWAVGVGLSVQLGN